RAWESGEGDIGVALSRNRLRLTRRSQNREVRARQVALGKPLQALFVAAASLLDFTKLNKAKSSIDERHFPVTNRRRVHQDDRPVAIDPGVPVKEFQAPLKTGDRGGKSLLSIECDASPMIPRNEASRTKGVKQIGRGAPHHAARAIGRGQQYANPCREQ